MHPIKQDSLAEMMETKKRPLLVRAFLPLLWWTVRHRFYGVFVRGHEHLAEAATGEWPLLLCSNHTNWWDGFVAGLLTPSLPGRDLYFVQYEKLLRRYPMCRWLGAFGIDIHGSPLAGLRTALRILARPRSAIWIFPQGTIAPQWVPIEIKPGTLWLARKSGAHVLPVVMRYEWLIESRPSVFIHCGPALPPETSDAELQAAMQQLFDTIGPTLHPVDLSPYKALYPSKPSMNRLWDWLCRRELGNVRNE